MRGGAPARIRCFSRSVSFGFARRAESPIALLRGDPFEHAVEPLHRAATSTRL
jgi:hypothetical protein